MGQSQSSADFIEYRRQSRRTRTPKPSLVSTVSTANHAVAAPSEYVGGRDFETLVASLHSRAPILQRSSRRAPGTNNDNNGSTGNLVYKLLARDISGATLTRQVRGKPSNAERLHQLGGNHLKKRLDSSGLLDDLRQLEASVASVDWDGVRTAVSKITLRLLSHPTDPYQNSQPIVDPHLPDNTPRFYCGGGRQGLERDVFCQGNGVQLFMKILQQPDFLMLHTNDARQLRSISHLNNTGNEVLGVLRELVYFNPTLVLEGTILDNGKFVPWLFTLLAHDSVFDGAAALIEEILSIMATQTHHTPQELELPGEPRTRVVLARTFFLGEIVDLYELWRGFTSRQLCHFCRILAMLVFEPEDRQLLESPAVLRSLELLQLRRNRAVRAGQDSTVDMNQAIVLGDSVLIRRILQILNVMNYAPPIRRFSPYHVMARYPLVPDTLIMLGLTEFESWDEIDRQDQLARKLQTADQALSELGSITDMLESLGETFNGQQPNQISNIIQVISAAQRAGVVVGRNSRSGAQDSQISTSGDSTGNASGGAGGAGDAAVQSADGSAATLQSLVNVAGILTDQILVRQMPSPEREAVDDGIDDAHPHHSINSPRDAANSLQFNAIMLGPYQVEMLFVLCTLLGGRRKLDAQDTLLELGVIPMLNNMFERLPWSRLSQDLEPPSEDGGIHGPGCECTPESALCVQYLRLLHNVCDRDCDNFEGRQRLLSEAEKREIFYDETYVNDDQPGLLSKIIKAFMRESDESPYRFWLASCIEAFLRGASPREQLFVAQSGLLAHLVEEVSTQKLHCAGVLQTSFDLLGEIGKGNIEVVHMLMSGLDEDSFRNLLTVATSHLVDSNVFIRSLLLSVERFSSSRGGVPLHVNTGSFNGWKSRAGSTARSYLTHSWWDAAARDVDEASKRFDERPTDWFPSRNQVPFFQVDERFPTFLCTDGDWKFVPEPDRRLDPATYVPSTERLSWFLAVNQGLLLQKLLEVVDLSNISHENICCGNTCVLITVFARRNGTLASVLDYLRSSNSARNFSHVLWFWSEYYTRRGRDRLSLEFSSHVRFEEWHALVKEFTRDDGSALSLLQRPARLPRSPYQRAARLPEWTS